MLASHLLWSIWDLFQSSSEASGLGFLENALSRREEYQVHKEILLSILEGEIKRRRHSIGTESTGSKDPEKVMGVLEEANEEKVEEFLKRMNKLHEGMTKYKSTATKRIKMEFKTSRNSLFPNK